MHELAALVLLNIRHLEGAVGSLNGAVVSHLAAHLGIERRLVQHQDALHALSQLVPQFPVGHQGQDSALLAGAIIAYELRGGHVLAELDACPAQVAQGLPGLAGADLLLFHQSLEALLVHGHAGLLRHLHGQVDGEAVGVVQLEGVSAGEHGLPLGLVGGEHIVIDLHAGVQGLGEVLLLRADDLGDIGLPLPQLGIVALVLMDHGVAHLI